MPISLRHTKLFRPTLAGRWVEREALLRRLSQGLESRRPLTLVSAPAGYGKSTLVNAWLEKLGRPATWLSLEELDDEPVRFMLYFIAALQRLEPAFGSELFAVLQAGQLPPVDTLITTLVNEMLAWSEPHILVLDDFHSIQHRLILEFLNGLLAHQPASFHLVILTREDPALPLARLRARGQLTEIRMAELRFSTAESALLMRSVLGLELSDQDIHDLTERTEGWAAGLQLAGLSLQGSQTPSALIQTLSGGHRFILGYLTGEVLKHQPAEIQDFLLQTSILSQLTGDLCDAVTGHTGGAQRLEELYAANLFLVPLDDEGCWYRYHHLFAQLLQTQLRRLHPRLLPELHRRASEWYAAHAFPADALEHAAAADNPSRLVALLEEYSWLLLNQGYTRAIETWMQALPLELQQHSPKLSLNLAWLHLLRGNFPQSFHYVRQAQAALEKAPQETADARLQHAECLALLANLHQVQGDFPASIQAAQQALALIEPDNSRLAGLAWLALGASYRQSASFASAVEALEKSALVSQQSQEWVTWMLAISHLTLMAIEYGQLRYAVSTATKAVEQIKRLSIAPPPLIGSVYGGLGLALYEMGQVEAGRKYLDESIRLGKFSGHNASLVYSLVYLARLRQAEGDLQAALHLLDEAAGLLRLGVPGWARPETIYRRVSVLLALDRPDEAQAELLQSGISPADAITPHTEWLHLAWLRWLAWRKDPAALALAERLCQFGEATQRHAVTLHSLVLGSLAGGGKDWLRRALALAEPLGYLRIFVDEGEPLAEILRQLPPSAYTRQLLACFPPALEQARPSTPSTELIVPLSEREIEVLRLLAEGLTYAEIAERLVVSLNTVRYHVKRVYARLGVEKQTQAIERGRELGLI